MKYTLILLVFALSACSDVKLKDAALNVLSMSKVEVNFCTTSADTIKSNLKFIFVIDRSGSNQQRYDLNNNNAPLPGTDPTGSRRFDAVLQFVQSFQADPNIYWSLVNFASSSTVVRNFTNDKDSFYNTIVDQKNRTAQIDGGDTDYLGALSDVNGLISDDITRAQSTIPIMSSNYVIFYVSDGSPIVNGVLQNQNSIYGSVDNTMLLQQGQKKYVESIQINTGYYSVPPIDPGAAILLNGISTHGKGDYLEFSNGQQIDFGRFTVPTRISRFALKEIWITNANSVWEGGLLIRDSDGDGLSDVLERQLGSNINNPDSDGNGVSDGVEYRITGNARPCKNASCSSGGADPYTTCRGLEISTSPVVYGDRDNDVLNDCEEKLLGSDMTEFDTNQDYIPDHLAFLKNISISQQSNANNLDPDQDGMTDYQEVKGNTPTRFKNDLVSDLKIQKYIGTLISTSGDQDCYRFDVKDMAFHNRNDIMRVYIMENTQVIGDHRLMRKAEKPSNFGAVYFYNEDFK